AGAWLNKERELSGGWCARSVSKMQTNSYLPGGVGKNLNTLDPHRGSRAQFDAAHHAVPIPLGMIGDTVRVDPDIDHQTVVDSNGKLMLSGRKAAEVIFVGCGEAVIGTDFLGIHPNPRLPMRPLE